MVGKVPVTLVGNGCDGFGVGDALVLGENDRETVAACFAAASDGDPLAASLPDSRAHGPGLVQMGLNLARHRVDSNLAERPSSRRADT